VVQQYGYNLDSSEPPKDGNTQAHCPHVNAEGVYFGTEGDSEVRQYDKVREKE
jgi:hypothetical protein